MEAASAEFQDALKVLRLAAANRSLAAVVGGKVAITLARVADRQNAYACETILNGMGRADLQEGAAPIAALGALRR